MRTKHLNKEQVGEIQTLAESEYEEYMDYLSEGGISIESDDFDVAFDIEEEMYGQELTDRLNDEYCRLMDEGRAYREANKDVFTQSELNDDFYTGFIYP